MVGQTKTDILMIGEDLRWQKGKIVRIKQIDVGLIFPHIIQVTGRDDAETAGLNHFPF
ncbi:hypothetical protein ALO_11819 [Acetonema longum DSM 6540]|uniref:Uncharacterized protein n=1 Tax=Acetonema longum DSM 6540 TaxID=1009370 RepID=F7NJV4_9FIRM|nr:hypothetical protein ALO_11819 [Acetonema longum DSM 6540]